jgi:hypothetical protein
MKYKASQVSKSNKCHRQDTREPIKPNNFSYKCDRIYRRSCQISEKLLQQGIQLNCVQIVFGIESKRNFSDQDRQRDRSFVGDPPGRGDA